MAKKEETTIKLPPATTLKSLAIAKDKLKKQLKHAKDGFDARRNVDTDSTFPINRGGLQAFPHTAETDAKR